MAQDASLAKDIILRLASYVRHDLEVEKRTETQAIERHSLRYNANNLTPEKMALFRRMNRMTEQELRQFINSDNLIADDMVDEELVFPRRIKNALPPKSMFTVTEPEASSQSSSAMPSRKRPRIRCKFCTGPATHFDQHTETNVCLKQACVDQISC